MKTAKELFENINLEKVYDDNHIVKYQNLNAKKSGEIKRIKFILTEDESVTIEIVGVSKSVARGFRLWNFLDDTEYLKLSEAIHKQIKELSPMYYNSEDKFECIDMQLEKNFSMAYQIEQIQHNNKCKKVGEIIPNE